MTYNDVAYQVTPKGKKSRNYDEKVIKTWKNHFLSVMTSTHLNFPFPQWCKLVEQGNITLNLLRPYRLNLKLSAYGQVFSNFYCQKTPFPPPGMKLLAHVLPIDRLPFYPHVIKVFSVGIAMEN